MKKTKRLLPLYIIMVLCVFALSGCSGADYEGKDLVDKAKKLHTEREAAHIQVEDMISGEVVQDITYRFVGDVMQYMYIGRDPETGEEYYEFNNGTELDTWHTGDTEWTFAAKGSEDYYSYSRAKRHYFADGNLLLDDHAAAVSGSSVTDETIGWKVIHLTYSDDKIAQSEQMSGVTGYSQTYFTDFDDSELNCFEMTTSYQKEGKEYWYLIHIESTDPADPIERIEPPALSGEITETVQ